jgi:hypothetical protein
VRSDRFDRFLPFAGVLIGLLFLVALVLLRNDPSSETGVAKTFAYWHDNRGQHQIIALLITPLVAFLLIFFGAGLRRRLATGAATPGTAPSRSAARSSQRRPLRLSACSRPR